MFSRIFLNSYRVLPLYRPIGSGSFRRELQPRLSLAIYKGQRYCASSAKKANPENSKSKKTEEKSSVQTRNKWEDVRDVSEVVWEDRFDRRPFNELTLSEKGARVAQDSSYGLAIGLAAVAIVGVVYVLVNELFSSSSPGRVYSRTLKLVRNNPEIQDILGGSIKGYGEGYRRRRHVSNVVFERDGQPHMRMRFYVKGTDKSGTVNLEVNTATNEYRYLFVEINELTPRTIVLYDNR